MKIGGYKDNAKSVDIDLSTDVEDTSTISEDQESQEPSVEAPESNPEVQDTSDVIAPQVEEEPEASTEQQQQVDPEGSTEDSPQEVDTNTEQEDQADLSGTDAVQVVEPSEVNEEQLLKSLSEKLGRDITSFDDLTEKENPLDKDPYLKKLSEWREKTGRPIEDWIKFQKNYLEVSDTEVAREFLQLEYPELSPEEVELELSTKFVSTEDDMDTEAALKNLELKKYASKGRKELSKLVSELGDPSKVEYPTEVQNDLAIAKEYKTLREKAEADSKKYSSVISEKASQMKSIKLDLAGDISLDFKMPEGSSKSIVESIQNAPQWKNADGSWNHDAIVRDTAIMSNFESIVNLAYEQGKNSGTDAVIKDAKNTTLGNRQSNDSALPNQSKGVEIEGLDNYLGKKGMSIIRGR